MHASSKFEPIQLACHLKVVQGHKILSSAVAKRCLRTRLDCNLSKIFLVPIFASTKQADVYQMSRVASSMPTNFDHYFTHGSFHLLFAHALVV